MLGRRILTGVVVVPVLVAMAFDDGWWFRLGIFATGLLGTAEALWMVRQAGHRPLSPFALLLAATVLAEATAVPFASVCSVGASSWILQPAIGLIVLGSLASLLLRSDLHGSLTDWALTLALPLYVAGLLQFFAPLRCRADAGLLTWPALVLATSWVCDSAAFFAGRALGRTRLAPPISPSKSCEGAVVGLLAAMLVGMLFSLLTDASVARMAGFGLAVGLASIVGDLVESLVKRQCGVKDSGFLMPGHGGLLDRMDALIFSAAMAYFYLQVPL